MTEDPVDEAVRLLLRRREEMVAEVEKIDNALTSLGRPVPRAGGGGVHFTVGGGLIPIDIERSGFSVATRPSVRAMLVALLDEADRDWNVAEVLAEYRRRGTPVHGKDPENALRAAVNEAFKAGQIERTATGRYRSRNWGRNAAGGASG